MASSLPHLRLLRDDDPPRVDRNEKPKRGSRPMPGLYRPTTSCRRCPDCEAKPKRTCQQKIQQKVWVLRRQIKGIRFQESTGCTDTRAAMAAAKDLIDEWERQAVGLPPKARGRRPLGEALEAFEKFLRTGRGKAAQRAKVMRQLREVIEEAAKVAAVDFLDELSDEVYTDWLRYAEANNFANRTINDRIRALKRFGKWLRGTRRLDHDPFEILRLLPDKGDLRQLRRALWPDEAKALVRSALRRQVEEEQAKNAAASGEVTPAVRERRRRRLQELRRDGHHRALIYFTCLRTGLRRAEVQGVRICDVQFGRKQIRIPPAVAKTRVEQFVQFPPDLARHLRTFIRRLGVVDRGERLFAYRGPRRGDRAPKTWVPGMPAFDKDLAHAGIAKQDETDRVVVFHSLRKSYITYLLLAHHQDGEIRNLQDIQRLARHSDIKLTLSIYVDWEKLAGREWAAAERLAGWMRG